MKDRPASLGITCGQDAVSPSLFGFNNNITIKIQYPTKFLQNLGWNLSALWVIEPGIEEGPTAILLLLHSAKNIIIIIIITIIIVNFLQFPLIHAAWCVLLSIIIIT